MKKKEIKYAFSEPKYYQEVQDYIDSTYGQHYGQGIQTAEYIMSHSFSPDFFTGNVMAYMARYGRKDGYNRMDILKALHFCYMLLYWHDSKVKGEKDALAT